MYFWHATAMVPTDGNKIGFNVQQGKFEASGDVQFSFVRWNETSVNAFDYKTLITVPGGGGIAETHDGMMFDAPMDGYAPVWENAQIMGTEGYETGKSFRFYLRTSAGKYAALEVSINQTARPYAQIRLTAYYNPSGSRNLEYNGDLRINKR